ncbi:MAG: helix-turn-helix domain-containing protein [Clostridiales bacterium]|jgi:transcriptional regulator with XRE-family HTH domain|nr:helix-turn-helix domain-containing protein [Clostridiales bacterium]
MGLVFGEALKAARADASLTQAALAKAFGCSIRAIQGWEQLERVPNYMTQKTALEFLQGYGQKGAPPPRQTLLYEKLEALGIITFQDSKLERPLKEYPNECPPLYVPVALKSALFHAVDQNPGPMFDLVRRREEYGDKTAAYAAMSRFLTDGHIPFKDAEDVEEI